MRMKECIVKVWKEILFAFAMIVYLVQLSDLNKELNFMDFDSSFELLQYRDFIAVKFFIVALVLFFIGCVLVWQGMRCLLRKCDSFEEMITMILVIAGIVGLLILLIIFINNPILKAILTVVLCVCGFISIKG